MHTATHFGGHAPYVKDGKLKYVYNYLGENEQMITSAIDVPTGKVVLGVAFAKEKLQAIRNSPAPNQCVGTAALYINDQKFGALMGMTTQLGKFALCGEGQLDTSLSGCDKPKFTLMTKGVTAMPTQLASWNDGPVKPPSIWSRIGKRPILAAGNSNGDIQMLQFANKPPRPALRLLVLHNDAAREFDYVTGAEKSLELAKQYGWSIVSIKNDWQTVFA